MATPPQLPPGVQALRYASMDTFFRRVVYFPSGSLDYAQRQLVTDIYQTLFNRGLPRLAPAKKHPEWKYGYACLMAYDASPKGPSLPHGQPFLSKLAGASGKVPTCTSWSSVVRARNRPARLFIHTCSNNARHTNLNSLEIYPIEARLGLSL